ncbi:Asp-tRNA(Asn)/Glu-tRNA(Gln) amidotransferase subunit GatB [Dyadobacter tibetensis]|uniref:Asp-tRNA(Asn)/Glu-tRNA(Gln) amidotransferase subunit GatB n=1 Tax=Dyadobacter tibetensis TaxID=1211851 RepID=UPI000470D04B|nr:Asp-tRNA(Asn)/Glu-tRNA(Gln) amidotransferase subunit GatB [Dyadobacter tibetensis]
MIEKAPQPIELTDDIIQSYEAVIGLEVHCQLQTNSKLFTQDLNQFGTDPNTNVGPITIALPGTLPKVNKTAVEYAIRLGLACGSSINQYSIFDRKNYFYPDLPKGYQISQDKHPICLQGGVAITAKGADGKVADRFIRFHHIHLEEDAGKSVHEGSDENTFLDYNRAGTPLVEMVSEPDLRSAEETGAFVTEIRRIVRYLGISDGNMEEGSLRADVNVSVRKKGEQALGTKVEIKNMNSIRNMMKAIHFETQRQIEALESGQALIQETRMFNVETGETYGMRVKETMNDYRYFPDPDLTPLVVSDAWLAEIKQAMPALPHELREKFVTQYGIPAYDAAVLTDSKELAAYFEEVCTQTTAYKTVSNWLMGPVKSFLNEHEGDIAQFPLSATKLAELIALSEADLVSHSTAAQKIYPLLLDDPTLDPKEIAQSNNWLQNSNTGELETLIKEVMEAMPDKVSAYRKGKKGLMGLFVGEVMKKSKGSADPKKVNQLLSEML